ncbi:MAG: hypothetical protein AAF203_06000 [Pseudomonadota bacterium]
MLKAICLMFAMSLTFQAQAFDQASLDDSVQIEVSGRNLFLNYLEDEAPMKVRARTVLRLKAMAKRALRGQGIDFQKYVLYGVSIRAKSRGSAGQAGVLIGQDSATYFIPKGNGPFKQDRPKSFTLIDWDLSADSGKQNEKWQLFLTPNGKVIKLSSLELHLRKKAKKKKVSKTHRVQVPANKSGVAKKRTVHLRTLLSRAGVNLKGAELRKVVVRAKSLTSANNAELMIGGQVAARVRIPRGGPGDGNELFYWGTKDPSTFKRVVYTPRKNIKATSDKLWQLHLKSNTKFLWIDVTIAK